MVFISMHSSYSFIIISFVNEYFLKITMCILYVINCVRCNVSTPDSSAPLSEATSEENLPIKIVIYVLT